MRIYNSLGKKLEEFIPVKENLVSVYTCGPTVYHFATIGNFRTYTTSDVLVRTLKYLGYEVKFVMNLTDVGHLTGDNEGDADQGEDRLEKSAKKEGKTAWEVAQYYTEVFLDDFEKLNLTKPLLFAKATDHISEQIDLVKSLESKGLTYKIDDGIYFDTEKFEASGRKYGELSDLDQIKEGARVEPNPQKKSPRDFALWKFSPHNSKRDMEWDSPWGVGFPGWHIECSAMSMKYLGETIDIHLGGEDLRATHHPNEIAQSEGATDKKFVNYWIHGAFLQVDGTRMGKSLGNAYTVGDLIKKGYDPLALRYFYLSGHYRKSINFTFEALTASQTALEKLRHLYQEYLKDKSRTTLSPEKNEKIDKFKKDFADAIGNDLNMPVAISILWEVVKSNIPSSDKRDLMDDFDQVLGLRFDVVNNKQEVPEEIKNLIEKRDALRKEKKWEEADKIREEIVKAGYNVSDDQVA